MEGVCMEGVCLEGGLPELGVCLEGVRQAPSMLDRPPTHTLHPQGKDTIRYGQQRGGTHPTGMHTCLECSFSLTPLTILDPIKLIANRDAIFVDNC